MLDPRTGRIKDPTASRMFSGSPRTQGSAHYQIDERALQQELDEFKQDEALFNKFIIGLLKLEDEIKNYEGILID